MTINSYWKNTLRLFLGAGLVSIHGIVLVPVVIKFAGVEILGVYSLVTSILGFAFGVAPLGTGFLARRHLPSADTPEQRRDLFWPQWWAQTILTALAAGMIILALPYLAAWLGTAYAVEDMAWEAGAFLLAYLLFSQFSDYHRNTHRAGAYNLAMVIYPWLWLGLALATQMVIGVMNMPTLIAAQAISALAVGGYLALRATREMGIRFELPRRAAWFEDLRLGLPLVLTYATDVILAASDRFVIGATMSVREVGYYVPAYTLGILMLIIPRIAGILLLPALSRCVDAGQLKEGERLVNTLVQTFLALGIPFVLGAVILGKPVLALYATPEVAAAAWYVVPVVAAASLFYGLNLIFYSVLTVQMRTADMFHANLIGGVLNLTLNIILLPLFQHLLVPAVSTLVAYAIAWWIIRRKIHSCWKFSFPFGIFLRTTVAAVLMSMAVYLLQAWLISRVNQSVAIVLCLVFGFIVYGIGVYAFGVMRREQIGAMIIALRRSSTVGAT